MHLRLSQVRDVIAVARCGTIRGAARKLGVDQPAVTRNIRLLEHDLGAVLLDRTSAGVSLTEVGRAFVARVSLAQNELQRACEEASQASGRVVGRVVVGLSTGPQIELLPKVLPAFTRRYPEIDLDIREGLFPVLRQSMLSGEIDFYVGPAPSDRVGGELRVETLHDNHRLVFARPDHPLRSSTSFADLSDAGWVSTSATAYDIAELHPFFDELGLPRPRINAVTSSLMAMMMVASSTDLLALMPQQWMLLTGTAGLLVPLQLRERLKARSIDLIHRSDLPLTPVAEHLSDLFRRAALNRLPMLESGEARPG